MIFKNATTAPKVYFGLHMVPGVAEYREPGQEPYRIFIGEQAIKNMDASFQGKPVYVNHVEEVNLENLQTEADGYVVRSFYNKADGKHWSEFIVVSDKGHEAIRMGWKLSNAYVLKKKSLGGRWHGVDYQNEITEGEYEHLAIVPNPRYDESVIFTPEQFKNYNASKENELIKLANANDKNKQGDQKMKFNFFKKQKLENAESVNLEDMSVVLPHSGIEMGLAELIKNADDMAIEKKKPQYANGESLVKVGEEEMSLNSLLEKYGIMCKNMEDEKDKEKVENKKKKNEEDEEEEKKKKKDEKAENEEDSEEEKKKKEKEAAEKKENSTDEDHFAIIANAEKIAGVKNTIDLGSDQIARGQARYGSK